MKLTYKFKVLAMSENKLEKEAVAVAEAGDMEKLKYLLHSTSRKGFVAEQAIIDADADLPEATRFIVNEEKYYEIGKYKLIWDLILAKGNKTKTVAAVIDNGMTMDQHMKDALLANALFASDGNANSSMAKMLVQKGADLKAATVLLEKGSEEGMYSIHRLLDAIKDSPVSREVFSVTIPVPAKKSPAVRFG